MRRVLPLLGVCVLLLSAQIEAKKTKSNKNQKNFWPIWSPSDSEKAPDDFTLEDIEGSGTDEDILTDKDKSNIHEDDEDFDEVGSGDGNFDGIDKDDIDLYDDDEFYDDYDYVDKATTMRPDSDDEDLVEGSGSGEGEPEESTEEPEVAAEPEPEVTTESTPLTPCMQLRAASLNLAAYVPDCDTEGEFKKQQCQDNKVDKFCWCVDPHGKKIKGTMLKFPTTPDCDFGTNLTTCVFQLVQNSQGLIGSYKPKCSEKGEYEWLQCHGSECWCVDKLGYEVPTSMKQLPEMPDCSVPTKKTPKTTSKPVQEKTTKVPKGYIVPVTDTNIIVNIEEDIIIDSGEMEQEEEDTNEINDSVFSEPQHHETRLLSKPGLLAAVIGGAVVGLLCMVLLVMFIVYRMRKKDEGSYALEEQKYQNYSYAKAPDKEFYA